MEQMLKILRKSFLIILTFFSSCSTLAPKSKIIPPQQINQHLLWYNAPAKEWLEAMPVGNGRLGAMVFGDPYHERIQLNEDSLWPGGPDWGNSKGNVEDLNFLRNLIKQGKIEQADREIVDRFSYQGVVRSHQTMGDLYVDFPDRGPVENYRRTLSLNNAEVVVSYDSEGAKYTQKVIASAPDNVLLIEFSTTSKEGMNLNLKLDRPKDHGHNTVRIGNPSGAEISMKGEVTQLGGKKFSQAAPLDYGVKFETLLKAETKGGIVSAHEGSLLLRGVKKATIKIVANTSYYDSKFLERNRAEMKRLSGKAYQEIFQAHVKDYQQFFNRVDFRLGNEHREEFPINVRLQKVSEGEEDLALIADLFQFGRYLLISSSRPGTNPANLQGIWNEHIEAPWNADYHLNVNLQMNYWPAEVTNLSELHMPLFDFTDRLIERGRITAKEQYGINRGAVAHQASDLWAPAFMRAEQPYWGSWIHGGGWLARHYWEHYLYTGDMDFLRSRGFPALKAFTEFYLDWLVWDEKSQRWISFPETSPENSYINSEGKSGAVAYGTAMGHQIIADVFDNVLSAASILEIEDRFVKEVKEKRSLLTPGIVIGPDGRLLEWNETFEEQEKGHRHISHLYALHPGDAINPAKPEIFDAAKKVIDYRLSHGGAGTGWSRAWMINFSARLLDGKAAEENVSKFLQISLADNLFDLHPPFQIDGNFGFTAGVAEMLLQSHEGFLRILPALPKSWKNGSISGLKARGDITVAIEWKEGKLNLLKLKSKKPKQLKVKYDSDEVLLDLPAGVEVKLDQQLNIISNK